MSRWSESDLARVNLRLKNAMQTPLTPVPATQPIRKYRNRTVIFQGQQFDSEHECTDWKNFELQRIAGAIRAVIRQVSFCLPGTRRRIRVDFLVVENDGKHVWYDSKGFQTKESSLKCQQVFDAYGITINLI